MNKKIVSVSIIGLGGRGGEAYGRYMAFLADKFKITHICDINTTRLHKYGDIFDVSIENRFEDENKFFEKSGATCFLLPHKTECTFAWQKKH